MKILFDIKKQIQLVYNKTWKYVNKRMINI